MPGFSNILGQEAVKDHLKKAIEYHKVSHAYILTGEKGMGKKMLANAFALSLLCEKGGSEPCMQCHSCRQVLSGNHPDLIYVTHDKPASIGVEDVRNQINDTIAVRPYNGGYKIYIVDEAEKMTVQAQNALLKTIEEPPSYAVILLLTANEDAFLPTILSRCVQLKLKPLKDSAVKEYLLETMGVKEQDADVYAAFARGNLGKAIHLASSEEFKLMHSEMLYLLNHLKEMDIADILNFIRKLREEEIDLYECLDFMQLWYRDVLMFKATHEIDGLVFRQEYNDIKNRADTSSYEGLEKIINAIETAKVRLQANVNFELTMELLFLTIREN